MIALFSPVARADEPVLGDAGHVAISVERLFGYGHESRTQTVGSTESTQTSNNVSLLGGASVTSYNIPRLGIDFFVARNFSLGFAGAMLHRSLSFTMFADQSVTLYQLAPRLGYALQLSPRLHMWPRAGVTYLHGSLSVDASASAPGQTTASSLTAVSLDVPFALQVAGRVAFLLEPYAEIGVGGSTSNSFSQMGTADQKDTEFGLQFGVLVFL